MIFLLFTFLNMAFAAPPSFDCGDDQWLDGPNYDNGFWSTTLRIDCPSKPTDVVSLEKVFQALQDEQKAVIKIIKGPIFETKGDVKSALYLVVDSGSDPDEEKIEFTQSVLIESDFKTFTRQTVEPTEFRAEGNNKYLKKLKNIYEITKNIKGDGFTVTVINHTEVEKPGFAPTFLFKPIVKDRVKKKTRKVIIRWAEQLMKEIR